MANVLNNILLNIDNNKPPVIDVNMDTKYKAKPTAPTAKLLPSRIIGSPIECAKDFKNDILSIKKAVKGEANDHELGRINGLALKLGSGGIAGYLFVKNPSKLTKTMAVVGGGGFLASMELWPKLAIQLPLKARTGVDFRQEYIDSQGRKKSLYQDNQYVLTDLLSRKDLDTIGEKMNINKNLPDRDSYIKQRAQKTALQANTLWMATAGFATPIMTGLICNASEKCLKPVIEKYELYKTQKELDNYNKKPDVVKSDTKKKIDLFVKFLENNKQNKLDDKMLEKIAKEFDLLIYDDGISKMLLDEYRKDLKSALFNVDENLINKAFGENTIVSLPKGVQARISKIINDEKAKNKLEQISDRLSNLDIEVTVDNGKTTLQKLGKKGIEKHIKAAMPKTVGDYMENLKTVYGSFAKYIADKKVLDGFVDARVGDRMGSYNANAWEKTATKFIDILELDSSVSATELKKIKEGDAKLIEEKFREFCKSENYEKSLKEFIELFDDYNNKTKDTIENIRTLTTDELKNSKEKNAAYKIFETFRENLEKSGFKNTAKMVSNPENQVGSIYNTYEKNNAAKISPNRSTFYRILQAFDLFKQAENSNFDDKLCKIIDEVATDLKEQNSQEFKTRESLDRITQKCKDIVMRSLTVDHVEQLTTRGFDVEKFEYKVAMKLLTDENDVEILSKYKGKRDISELTNDYKKYKQELREYIADWINPMNPDFKNSKISENGTNGKNCAKRSETVGESVANMVIKQAKKHYNTKKWQIMFGGIMAGLTAGTLIVGSFLGGKTPTEKIAEKELKESGKNG